MKLAIQGMLLALMPCMAEISGTLVNSANQPLAGCEVKLGAAVALSDATGAFKLNSVTGIAPFPSERLLSSERGWKVTDRPGLEIFNVRGNRIGGFEQGPARYILRPASGSLQVRPLGKSASAADSLQIKCSGYAPMKVQVDGPNANLGSIKVTAPDSVLPGVHVDYNPYAEQGAAWFKVITHSHTIAHESDRGTTPVKIAQAYKDLGMHAVAFTDHDAFTKPASVAGILYIPGEEVTTSDGDMNVFGINKAVPGNMSGQKVIDAAIANGNGFTQVNHPLDSDANDGGRLLPYLTGLKNLWGIEVYNGGRLSQDATAAWDHLISQKKRVWATAGDDAHSILVIDDGAGVPETGRKWIVVNSAEQTVDGILANMRVGNFYATEGPDMRISVKGDIVSVSSASGNSVTWFTTNRKQIKKTTLAAAPDTYTLTGSEIFVRVLITDSKGKRALSQPIFTK